MKMLITLAIFFGLILSTATSPSRASELFESEFEAMPVRVEIYENRALQQPAKKMAGATGVEIHNDDFVQQEQDAQSLESRYPEAPDRVYHAPAFAFHRLPHRYDETGARELRDGPILFRATSQLTLGEETHQLLIRTRNDARIFLDGREIAFVAGIEGRPDGHNPVRETPPLIEPKIKEFAPGNAEKVFTLEADGLPHTFVVETTIGASQRRLEIGDFSVAIRLRGEGGFRIFGANSPIAFTDEGWADYVEREESRYRRIDSQERADRSSQESKYWAKRHAFAKRWVERHEPIAVPTVSDLIPVSNPIDQFIGRALEEAALRHQDEAEAKRAARAKGVVLFDQDIQPILQENCIKCHGEQEKGGLRLDSLESVLAGGDSGEPAIVPGRPQQSLLVDLISTEDDFSFMPPSGRRLTQEEQSLISRWVQQGAAWSHVESAPIAANRFPTADELREVALQPKPRIDDLAFLRRIYLDTVGQIPTVEAIQAFVGNAAADKRAQTIDQLLEDERWADHWAPFWQDLLAENPNIVKPNLNNTGAFRWWIHESFLDNKPMDRFVTDLIRMRGNQYVGPAGFGMATQNDAPMAAKATILGSVFMGVKMTCARCHDAPFQSVMQEELFAMAAMLERKPIAIPATSIVPPDRMGHRNPLIQVSLAPGEVVEPRWMFDRISHEPLPSRLTKVLEDPRELLAAHLTSPANTRFAQSIVNWTWKRYFGRGLVEPATDWENGDVSHPELLEYLARELVENNYDLKHICRLLFNSHTYQQEVLLDPDSRAAQLFAGQTRRRMTAEQIVDSLHLATSSEIDSDELNLDQDGRRLTKHFINLGKPRRGWEFTSLSNERDRPSLTLPHAQVYVDVLEVFGWNGSRQSSIVERDHETNVMQPAVLANGVMSQRMTRLTDDHELTAIAVEAEDLNLLIETLFLKTLSRYPDDVERQMFTELLSEGFADRVAPEDQWSPPPQRTRYPYVTWSNHLRSEANEIKECIARDIERGDPPTRYLRGPWRERMEDAVWVLINTPEMIFVP